MEDCDCGKPDEWLTPDRRAELRNGAVPRTPAEKQFQTRYFEHLAHRAAAEARRG